jgi:transposase-like protein
MSRRRKTYTRDFEPEVLHLAENIDKPTAHLEQDLGLSVGTIQHWRRQVLVDGEEAFPGSGRVTGQAKMVRHKDARSRSCATHGTFQEQLLPCSHRTSSQVRIRRRKPAGVHSASHVPRVGHLT